MSSGAVVWRCCWNSYSVQIYSKIFHTQQADKVSKALHTTQKSPSHIPMLSYTIIYMYHHWYTSLYISIYIHIYPYIQIFTYIILYNHICTYIYILKIHKDTYRDFFFPEVWEVLCASFVVRSSTGKYFVRAL